jgi:hypothetical protein
MAKQTMYTCDSCGGPTVKRGGVDDDYPTVQINGRRIDTCSVCEELPYDEVINRVAHTTRLPHRVETD